MDSGHRWEEEAAYFRVIAVDSGYRNLSYCVLSSLQSTQPIKWEHVDLFPNSKNTPTRTELLEATHTWMLGIREQFELATHIILEKQMRKLYIAQNSFIAGRYWGKVHFVHATTVGRFWNLPTRRDRKKAAGIEVVHEHGVQFPNGKFKRDDLADAWMMAARQVRLLEHEQRQNKLI